MDDTNVMTDALTDPNTVHVNMLAGRIAKPSPAQIWHIYGAELLAAMPTPGAAGIVERLRAYRPTSEWGDPIHHVICDEAAATIAAQAAENERLRAAAANQNAAIAEYYRYWTGGETRGSYDGKPERNALWASMHKARAVLATSQVRHD